MDSTYRNGAPQILGVGGEAEETEIELDEKAMEILRARELERQLENERPCVFKSLSPVGCFDRGVLD